MENQNQEARLHPYCQSAWLDTLGSAVTHQEHGDGSIVEVKLREDYFPLLTVKFKNKVMVCNPSSFFKDGSVSFSDNGLAEKLHGIWIGLKEELERKRLWAAESALNIKKTERRLSISPGASTQEHSHDVDEAMDQMRDEISQGQENWARSKSSGWFYDDND